MNEVFFDNPRLKELLLRQGYILADFITADMLKQLREFYRENVQPTVHDGFHTTHFSSDTSYKKSVNDGIIQILHPVLEKYLPDHVPAFANFMIKNGGGNNPMPLHADWTYVEEPKQMSLAIWIPLVDTTPQNGCLGVIPFSQHLSHHIRGPGLQQALPPYDRLLIKKMGKLLPMKAGQSIIYDHRLLHYSPPNNTNAVRPAINLSLVPKGTDIIHYTCPEGSDRIHKYTTNDPHFFIHYNSFQIPERGTLLKYIDKEEVPLVHDRTHDFIKQYNRNFFQKAAARLGL